MTRPLVSLLLLLITLFSPTALHAADAGFVPSTRIWFSRSVFDNKEQIKMYTVAVNNNYYALDATVGFYANGTLIQSVQIENLKKEEAKQLSAIWIPSEGTYTLTARFIEATAIDESGQRTRLELGALNDIGDVPIAIQREPGPGDRPTPETVQEKTTATIVQVQLTDEGTVITPLPPPAAPTSAHAALETFKQVEKFVNTVTTSAGTIEDTYQKTKEWIGKAEKGYKRGKDGLQAVQAYANEGKKIVQSWWAGNGTRKIIIGAGIVFFFLSVGLFFRRRGDLDTW